MKTCKDNYKTVKKQHEKSYQQCANYIKLLI